MVLLLLLGSIGVFSCREEQSFSIEKETALTYDSGFVMGVRRDDNEPGRWNLIRDQSFGGEQEDAIAIMLPGCARNGDLEISITLKEEHTFFLSGGGRVKLEAGTVLINRGKRKDSAVTFAQLSMHTFRRKKIKESLYWLRKEEQDHSRLTPEEVKGMKVTVYPPGTLDWYSP